MSGRAGQKKGEARARWTALAVLWPVTILVVTLLALAARTNGPLPGDVGITREVQEARPFGALLKTGMVAVSEPGYAPWAEISVVLPVGLLLLSGRWQTALFVALTAVGDLLSEALKLVVARPRPTLSLVSVYERVPGYSFPSGHVVHYVVLFGALSYLAARASRSESRTAVRSVLLGFVAICVGLIVLVGPARVYLGTHWPTDVLAGYLLGTAWLAFLIWAFRRWLGPCLPGRS